MGHPLVAQVTGNGSVGDKPITMNMIRVTTVVLLALYLSAAHAQLRSGANTVPSEPVPSLGATNPEAEDGNPYELPSPAEIEEQMKELQASGTKKSLDTTGGKEPSPTRELHS